MAPPHRVPHIANRTRSYYFAPGDTARARRVTRQYPCLSTKKSMGEPLPLGVGGNQVCFLPLDELGLPAANAMEHRYGCRCHGLQDAMVMNVFFKWVQYDAARLQIQPAMAAAVAEGLVSRWGVEPMDLPQVHRMLGPWMQRMQRARAQMEAAMGGHPVM